MRKKIVQSKVEASQAGMLEDNPGHVLIVKKTFK